MSDITIVSVIGASVASLAASLVAYIALRRESKRQREALGNPSGTTDSQLTSNGETLVDTEQSLRSHAYSYILNTTNIFFHLLNTGRIFPLFGLFLLAIMGLSVYRLPEAELAQVVKEFISAVRDSTGIMMFALIATNVGWIWLVNRQRKIYMEEIERLSDIRNRLLEHAMKKVAKTVSTDTTGDA